ncbi:MAG: hypothetical protein ACI9UK_001728 [Candidatus Krumholzibacteriia bacterium]|jgi:uncharacterized protein (TIGR01777 family)
MKFLVTGGTGFLGTALCARLISEGHDVVVLSRNPQSVPSPASAVGNIEDLSPDTVFEAVINLAGEPIANKRWDQSQQQRLIASRLNTTGQLISYFEKVTTKPRVFISSSAVGYYGVDPTEHPVDENFGTDDSFCSKLCQQWEAAALPAEGLGVRTVLLRTGLVLGRGGGALSKMLPAFRLGLGGVMGRGGQWMSWIHLDDLVGIMMHCLAQDDIRGAVNATAPHPVTNREFTKALGAQLGRPTVFPIPAFGIKLLFGQMGEELLLAGQRVLPSKITSAGFAFKHGTLSSALAEVLGPN